MTDKGKMIVKILGDEEYDVEFSPSDGFDYHISPSEVGGFTLDIFDSTIEDKDAAYRQTLLFDELAEALGFVLTGEH